MVFGLMQMAGQVEAISSFDLGVPVQFRSWSVICFGRVIDANEGGCTALMPSQRSEGVGLDTDDTQVNIQTGNLILS